MDSSLTSPSSETHPSTPQFPPARPRRRRLSVLGVIALAFLLTGCKISSVELRGNEKIIATERDGVQREIAADEILIGVGRVPAVEGLNLEAAMIETALEDWNLEELDFLFIENVGNLVCPSSYDLGENLRLVLLSVTEGEDKPLKYPTILNSSDVAVVTKVDLAEAVEFDWTAVEANIQAVRPGMPVLRVSAKTGLGMDAWLASLPSRRR